MSLFVAFSWTTIIHFFYNVLWMCTWHWIAFFAYLSKTVSPAVFDFLSWSNQSHHNFYWCDIQNFNLSYCSIYFVFACQIALKYPLVLWSNASNSKPLAIRVSGILVLFYSYVTNFNTPHLACFALRTFLFILFIEFHNDVTVFVS